MRFLFTLCLSLISLNAFAFLKDRSVELSRVLSDNYIEPSGKNQSQEASAECEIPPRSGEVECRIFVTSPGFGPYSVYEELKGCAAKELSDLLSQFYIEPTGKRSTQRVAIKCSIPKPPLGPTTDCSVVELSQFSDG